MTSTLLAPLRHLPLSLFAIVMGLSGFSLVLQRGGDQFGFSAQPGYVVAWLALGIYGLLVGSYGLKAARHGAEVLREFNHPVKLSFLPAISIGLMLLGIAFQPMLSQFSRGLVLTALPLQLGFTLFVISRWINLDHYEVHHANPAWFIPAVGNILVPIAVVPLGYTEAGWFFFSIGVVFWLVLLTIILYRVIFHVPLPRGLIPTYVILLAPPAVGFLAYLKLNGSLDAFARILYYFGLFTALLLVVLVPRFLKLRFSITWWAYSFPPAAFTLATMVMADRVGSSLFTALALGLLCFLCLLIPLLCFLTLRDLVQGKILVAD